MQNQWSLTSNSCHLHSAMVVTSSTLPIHIFSCRCDLRATLPPGQPSESHRQVVGGARYRSRWSNWCESYLVQWVQRYTGGECEGLKGASNWVQLNALRSSSGTCMITLLVLTSFIWDARGRKTLVMGPSQRRLLTPALSLLIHFVEPFPQTFGRG